MTIDAAGKSTGAFAALCGVAVENSGTAREMAGRLQRGVSAANKGSAIVAPTAAVHTT